VNLEFRTCARSLHHDGNSVFIALQDGNGAVSVLMIYLESAAPTLSNYTLKLAMPAGQAGEYTI